MQHAWILFVALQESLLYRQRKKVLLYIIYSEMKEKNLRFFSFISLYIMYNRTFFLCLYNKLSCKATNRIQACCIRKRKYQFLHTGLLKGCNTLANCNPATNERG